MAAMLRSTQTAASSSGTDAPSRKLKAERACSSLYINRTFPAQTIPGEGRHSRRNTGPSAGFVARFAMNFVWVNLAEINPAATNPAAENDGWFVRGHWKRNRN